MTIHNLKTDRKVFEASQTCNRMYEIRRMDRDFKVNDILFLEETVYSGEEIATGKPLAYTGRSLLRRITHILEGPCYGLAEGWGILSVKETCITAKDYDNR